VTYLDRFLHFLDTLPDSLIYFLLGLSAFLENVFPPAPGDTVTAFGAFLVGTNRLHFFSMFVATTLGSLAGFMFLFWIGGLLGRRFFIQRDLWYFKAKDIIRAEEWFRRYGYFLVLMNRFFPGIRSVISIAGGISKLNAAKVALLALISCSVWNLIWISAGYTLGTNWETAKARIEAILKSYNVTILVIFAIVILFLMVRRALKKRRGENGRR
jgi:membrane protein DedA with SNARE-associated domain